MMHRLLTTLPVVGIFSATSLIFLAAHAPRTWAAHWSTPRQVGTAAGVHEYSVLDRGSSSWDFLWVNDDARTLVFTSSAGVHQISSTILDHGDVQQPTLIRRGRYLLGVWVRNRNGATDLMAALLQPSSRSRVFRLIDSPQPIEHPYLFSRPNGSMGLIFSWQRFGNFDLFLMTIALPRGQVSAPVRLTRSEFYSFYPRAITSRTGRIIVLHPESCCQQEFWNMDLDLFDGQGRHVGVPTVLNQFPGVAQTRSVPTQWGEDLRSDASGTIWGGFAVYGGILLFKATPEGRLLVKPKVIVQVPTVASAVALVLDNTGGYVFWDQTYDLGSYIDSQRFDQDLRPIGAPERLAYESASESNPRAVVVNGKIDVVWQATPAGATSHFEISSYRRAVQPNLAERLGLGLGNPWEEFAVLAVTSIGVAALTTMGNILTIFGLAALGLIALRILRPVPGKWLIYAVLLSAALYVAFVAPGGPILFLSTLPSMGLNAVPFGVIASMGALAFVGWTGVVALKRVEDLYRAGAMAVFGVYFFAFVEAVVFIQQRIGYI